MSFFVAAPIQAFQIIDSVILFYNIYSPPVLVFPECPYPHVVHSDYISTECSGSVYLVPLHVTLLRYGSACVLCCSIALLAISSSEVRPRSPTCIFIRVNISIIFEGVFNWSNRSTRNRRSRSAISIGSSRIKIDRRLIPNTYH